MKKILATVGIALFPVMVFAQAQVRDADSLILKIADIFNAVTWLLISLAVIYVIWNTVQFIKQSDSSERGKYQAAILWGIVGLFVIVSLWGLVYIVSNTFRAGNSRSSYDANADINSLMLRGNNTNSGTRINP